jgi:hypothetical protein
MQKKEIAVHLFYWHLIGKKSISAIPLDRGEVSASDLNGDVGEIPALQLFHSHPKKIIRASNTIHNLLMCTALHLYLKSALWVKATHKKTLQPNKKDWQRFDSFVSLRVRSCLEQFWYFCIWRIWRLCQQSTSWSGQVEKARRISLRLPLWRVVRRSAVFVRGFIQQPLRSLTLLSVRLPGSVWLMALKWLHIFRVLGITFRSTQLFLSAAAGSKTFRVSVITSFVVHLTRLVWKAVYRVVPSMAPSVRNNTEPV